MPLPHLRRRISGFRSNPAHRSPQRWWHRLLGLRPGERFWTWPRVGRIAALGAGAVALVVIIAVAWISQSLPDPNNLDHRVVAQSTKILARDEKTILYEIHGDQKRTVVDLDDIAPTAIQAAIATEDKDFYKHGGVSIRGTLRSIWVDITTGSKAQGGSTITQQLVRNAILTREKSFVRKIKEWVLAYQIERRFTKDQILRLYFNEIPYGGSAYGVESAARMYFGKSAKDLDIAESAMLTAIVKGPSYYSPTGSHRDELVARTKLVIDNMRAADYITDEQATEAKAVDILERIQPTRDPILAPHFTLYVRDLLVQKYGELEVERGGLRVVTTLDMNLQKIAEEEVAAGAIKNDKRGADNASLVAIDPRTGQVLAMVGSRDFFDKDHDGQFNVATAIRNPGSSFKPIVYLSAFARGYTPDTILFDLKTNFGPDGSGKNFIPNNYDFREHGPLKMRQTLAGSLNIPAVKTLYLAGLNPTLDLAEKLGYSTIDRSKVGLALAIGGGGVRLIEHVNAFAAIANDGQRNPVASILRIEDQRGKVLEEYEKKQEKAVDQNFARLLVDVMSDNGARAYVFGSRSPLVLPDRPVAAKTGTTNDWRDGWTMGFTPSIAAGVWVGNNDYTPMNRGMDGVVVAAPIWHNFMARATKGTKVERFPKPTKPKTTKPILQGQLANETEVMVDRETNKKIPDSCLSSWPTAYVKKVTVKEVHTILYYVDRNAPNGPEPAKRDADPMFSRWEKPVQDWAKKNGYVAKVPAEEKCSLRVSSSDAVISITSPTANQTISSSSVAVTVALTGFGEPVSVTYAVDGTTVSTSSSAPYGTTIDFGQTENGFHTITATATDAAGKTATASVTINSLAQSGTTLYFIQPSPHDKISTSSFPVAVRVFAHDQKGFVSLSLWSDNPNGTKSTLDHVTNPSSDTVVFSWPTTAPGSYKLFISAVTLGGKTIESDRLPVTVQ